MVSWPPSIGDNDPIWNFGTGVSLNAPAIADPSSQLHMRHDEPNSNGTNQIESSASRAAVRKQKVHGKITRPRKRDTRSERHFGCPVFEAEVVLGQEHGCRGVPAKNLAEVRRHLKQDKPNHPPFLELCKTCNEDIINRDDFENLHGRKGERCNTPRKQSRKGAQKSQWIALYRKLRPNAPLPEHYRVSLANSDQSATVEHDAQDPTRFASQISHQPTTTVPAYETVSSEHHNTLQWPPQPPLPFSPSCNPTNDSETHPIFNQATFLDNQWQGSMEDIIALPPRNLLLSGPSDFNGDAPSPSV